MGFLMPKAPKPQGPDPKIEKARRKAEAEAKAEKKALEAKEKEEKIQALAGNRGFRSLLTNSETGFPGADLLGASGTLV